MFIISVTEKLIDKTIDRLILKDQLTENHFSVSKVR